LVYGQLLSDDIIYELNQSIIGQISALNYATIYKDTTLLKLVFYLIKVKVQNAKNGAKYSKLEMYFFEALCLSMQENSVECFGLMTYKFKTIDDFVNDALVDIAPPHGGYRIIGHVIACDLNHKIPDEVLKELLAQATSDSLVTEICHFIQENLPASRLRIPHKSFDETLRRTEHTYFHDRCTAVSWVGC
jgi:hypothetical protein